MIAFLLAVTVAAVLPCKNIKVCAMYEDKWGKQVELCSQPLPERSWVPYVDAGQIGWMHGRKLVEYPNPDCEITTDG